MLSNREIEDLAQSLVSDWNAGNGKKVKKRAKKMMMRYDVITRSYSEKLCLAFNSESLAQRFVDELSKKGEKPIYKGWCRTGCIVEFLY